MSLSKPHIDHDNGPRVRNIGMYLFYVSIYLCIIYPTFVAPWFPRSVYTMKFSVYWHAYVHDLQLHSTEQQGLLVSAVKIIDEDR